MPQTPDPPAGGRPPRPGWTLWLDRVELAVGSVALVLIFASAAILLIGRGSIRHPSVFDPEQPVTGSRRLAGWFCILLFVITFIPLPLQT